MGRGRPDGSARAMHPPQTLRMTTRYAVDLTLHGTPRATRAALPTLATLAQTRVLRWLAGAPHRQLCASSRDGAQWPALVADGMRVEPRTDGVGAPKLTGPVARALFDRDAGPMTSLGVSTFILTPDGRAAALGGAAAHAILLAQEDAHAEREAAIDEAARVLRDRGRAVDAARDTGLMALRAFARSEPTMPAARLAVIGAELVHAEQRLAAAESALDARRGVVRPG